MDRNTIHPSQIGLQSGHRTADHSFTLKTIDEHINQNKNGKICACFVDFKKASDLVWHEGLFLKLLENKIDGNFYHLIKNLYSNSKCAVKESKRNRTEFFPYSKIVRHGCILSPLLFNIYINELATLFDSTAADPCILPNGTKLSCLLYADDLILLSQSELGLQKSPDDLHSWSKKWLMETNLKETQIMIFEKRKTKSRRIFYLGNQNIKIV